MFWGRMVIVIVMILISVQTSYAGLGSEWRYSLAAEKALQEKWKEAQGDMNALLVDAPDKAELLYDNGVAAYKLKEHEKAAAYFEQVIRKKGVEPQLKKQAHFNLGNADVGLKKYAEAIGQYQEALKIDPNDEKAKHNLKVVQQMLAQQQQQQNKDEQDKDDKDGQEDKQDQKGGNSSKKDKNKSEKSSEKNEQEQGDSSGEQKEEQQESGEQEQGDKQDSTHDSSQGEDTDKEQEKFGDNHASSQKSKDEKEDKKKQSQKKDSEKEKPEQGMQQGSVADKAEQEKEEFNQQFQKGEQWMAKALERREKADQQANKEMIKATVDSKLSGKNGQNNW